MRAPRPSPREHISGRGDIFYNEKDVTWRCQIFAVADGGYEWGVINHIDANHRIKRNNSEAIKPLVVLPGDDAILRNWFRTHRNYIRENDDRDGEKNDREFLTAKCQCSKRGSIRNEADGVIPHIASDRHELGRIEHLGRPYCPETFDTSPVKRHIR